MIKIQTQEEKEYINVDKALRAVCKRIDQNPFIIYSEADIQTLVHMELLKDDAREFQTKSIINGIKIKTNRVHREYLGYGKGKKSDIAIFSVDDIKNINHSGGILNMMGKNYPSKGKPVDRSHVIEIKFIRSGEKGEKLSDYVLVDFKKMRFEYSEQTSVKTKLYQLFIIRWNISGSETILKQKAHYKRINEELMKEPEIQFYLYYWPKDKWKDILHPIFKDNKAVVDLT